MIRDEYHNEVKEIKSIISLINTYNCIKPKVKDFMDFYLSVFIFYSFFCLLVSKIC